MVIGPQGPVIKKTSKSCLKSFCCLDVPINQTCLILLEVCCLGTCN